MNRLILLFVLLIIPNVALPRDSSFPHLAGYPSYREACVYFFSNYDVESLKNGSFYRFRFARMPDGWFVFPEEFASGELVPADTICLWNKQTGFSSSAAPKTAKIEKPETGDYLSNANLYNFSIYPFYGYAGWDLDVIKEFGDLPPESLSDEEVYGMGRAYSQRASDMFWSHSDFSPVVSHELEKSNKTVRQYLMYAKKGISCFGLLADRNPDYQTIVGSIKLKYANEIMAKWYELVIFGFEKKARRLLTSYPKIHTLYSGFWNTFSDAMLNIPDSHAILFTNGDNDTYPLLYMQAVKHVRPDIRIINTSLLNDPLYYRAILEQTTPGRTFSPTLTADEFSQLTKNGIYSIPSGGEPAGTFNDWTDQFLELSGKSSEPLTVRKKSYLYIYSTEENLSDTIELSENIPNFLRPGMFIIPALLMDFYPFSPVYFSKGCDPALIGMFASRNLPEQVMVFRLTGNAETAGNRNIIKNGEMYTDTSMINRFFQSTPVRLPDSAAPAEQRTFSWILSDISFLLKTEAEMMDTLRLRELVTRFFAQYPPEKCGINTAECDILNLWLASGGNGNIEGGEDLTGRFLRLLDKEQQNLEMTDDDLYDEFNARYLLWCIHLLRDAPHTGPQNFYSGLADVSKKIENKIYGMLTMSPVQK